MLNPRRVVTLNAVVLALVAAAAPAAQAATPSIHAHRGGMVVNTVPRYAEESTRERAGLASPTFRP
jgi:hypothetical protein